MPPVIDNCCGGSPSFTLAPAVVRPAAIGTGAALPNMTLNPIVFSGEADASTLLTDHRPNFSPADNPATAMVTRIATSKKYGVLGFAEACFSEPNKAVSTQEVMHPENWWRFAEFFTFSADDIRSAAHRMQFHFPGLRYGRWHANDDSPVVGTWMAYSDDTVFIFCTGTSNTDQYVYQAASSFLPLVECGPVKTSSFWCAAWTALAVRLAGYEFESLPKVVICGHSYGGVMAALFAVRIAEAHPDKEISLLTLGMPCAGDVAFADRLKEVRAVHLTNQGDNVAAVPPGGAQLESVAWLLTDGQLGAWQSFHPVHNRYMISSTGKYTFTNECPTSLGILQVVVEALAAGDIPEPFGAHAATEYLRRCRIIAGLPV